MSPWDIFKFRLLLSLTGETSSRCATWGFPQEMQFVSCVLMPNVGTGLLCSGADQLLPLKVLMFVCIKTFST